MRLACVPAVLIAASLIVLTGCKPKQEQPVADKVMTDTDKTFYALGALISKNLDSFQLTADELELVKSGLTDGVNKAKLKVNPEEFAPKLDELHQVRLATAGKKEAEAGQAYLAKAAAEAGATKTASGLVIKEIKAGTGASPKATDQVKVHYQGTLTDGKVFDSSIERGTPITFPLDGVIPCWTEGLQLMKVGGKSRLVCPADIAYGERGSPPTIKPGATLVFDVELIDIVK